MSIADRFDRAPPWLRMLLACAAIDVALLSSGPWLLDLNRQAWDVLFKLRNRAEAFRPRYEGSVVLVDVDDSTLRQLGVAQLSRPAHAELVRALSEFGVGPQLHDMIFARAGDGADDDPLVEATREGTRVDHGFALGLTPWPAHTTGQAPPGPSTELLAHSWNVRVQANTVRLQEGRNPLLPFDRLALAAAGLGFIDVLPDADGVIRRAPLLATYGGAVYPSAALLLSAGVLGVPPENVVLGPGNVIRLVGARMPGTGEHRDLRIPVDRDGNALINYIGPWESMTHYGAADILSARANRFDRDLLRSELQGKVAIIAYTSTGIADVAPVPSDAAFLLPGVHAHLVNTILARAFLREPAALPRVVVIDAPLIAAMSYLGMQLPPLALGLVTSGLVVFYVAIAFVAFIYGWLLPVYEPVVLLAACAGAGLVTRYGTEHRQREAMRQALDAYFPSRVVDRLLASPGGFRTTSVRKELSILFSDIAGFTEYAGRVDPESVQRALNEYFDAMVEIVFAHGGTVDKFIGDGLMVFFGDPEPQPDHAARSVQCALAMQRKAAVLRTAWSQRGGMPLHIRIGISTGEVVVGNMGSARRLSYTVIGNVVNIAQRLEASGNPDDILISHRTYELVDGAIRAEHAGPMALKGLADPVDVYRVVQNVAG